MAILRVRKGDRLLRENRDMYTVMVGKIGTYALMVGKTVTLPREYGTRFC